MFDYLCRVEGNISVFSSDVSLYEKACVWVLHNIFAKRYWQAVTMKQWAYYKADNRRYAKKLGDVLALYAAHVGEPAYSMVWFKSDIAELNDPEITIDAVPPRFLDMDDAEVAQYFKAKEVV